MDYDQDPIPTSPNVQRGRFWNHNGVLMLGYWDLLDECLILREKLATYEGNANGPASCQEAV